MGRSADPTRVLVVIGSESGTTTGIIRGIVSKWEKKLDGKPKSYVIEQTSRPSTDVASLMDKCDVLIVATSSYGEGDPPDNLERFFNALHAAAKGVDGAPPTQILSGLQHAVLGNGSSVYDTFQNCPRLLDKWIGECGSRRMAKRAELDETHDSNDPVEKQADYLRWADEMFGLIQALPSPDEKEVCAWTEPSAQILMPDEPGPSGPLGTMLMWMTLGAAVVVGVGYQLFFRDAAAAGEA